MDGRRFDNLARSLSRARSRRSVSRGLAIAGVGSLLPAALGFDLSETAAKKKGLSQEGLSPANQPL